MSIEVINFGCRLNTYEGDVIRANAEKAALENAIIFNSCAVTAEAERQVKQAIRRARKENPTAKIIVTGCGAQISPDDYAELPEVDLVIGNEEKLKPDAYSFMASEEKILVNDIMSIKETAAHIDSSSETRARAFVQVQNGCNHRCTFCIIPFGRGNSRSVPAGEVVNKIRTLTEQGFNEVVLTGVDISDYGKDLPGSPNLGSLLKRILTNVPELKRLRLSSIDAAEVDTKTQELFSSEARLMPHLHLSVQAGDDMILKRMKRRHSRADIISFTKRMRSLRPDIVFGADIIAGFPTESEEMFQNTFNLVEEAQLTYLHVFPYSARKNTPAAKMPQVVKSIRQERAKRLRELGKMQVSQYLNSLVGTTQNVIVEQNETGKTEGFASVKLSHKHQQGSIVRADIVSVENNHLICRNVA